MNAILRKDGSLYLRLHDDDTYRNLDNGIEIFLSPEQVEMVRSEIGKLSSERLGGNGIIRVYADWQPAYMDSPAQEEQKYFETLVEATPTIEEWRKTACTVVVSKSDETVIARYIWGKEKP